MEGPPGFVSRMLGIIRQKSFPLILLLACGETAIWLSGKASLGIMLLLVACVGFVAALGAVVRIWLEGRHKE